MTETVRNRDGDGDGDQLPPRRKTIGLPTPILEIDARDFIRRLARRIGRVVAWLRFQERGSAPAYWAGPERASADGGAVAGDRVVWATGAGTVIARFHEAAAR